MDMLKQTLRMLPAEQAAFEKAERQRERRMARDAERARSGDDRIAKAQAKRDRKNARRMAFAEGNGG